MHFGREWLDWSIAGNGKGDLPKQSEDTYVAAVGAYFLQCQKTVLGPFRSALLGTAGG